MSQLRTFLTTVLVLVTAVSANARRISFSTMPNFGSGVRRPNSIAVGDFNADGIPDLAVDNGINHLAIFLGKGDGRFVRSAFYTLNTYVQRQMAVAAGIGGCRLGHASPQRSTCSGPGPRRSRCSFSFAHLDRPEPPTAS